MSTHTFGFSFSFRSARRSFVTQLQSVEEKKLGNQTKKKKRLTTPKKNNPKTAKKNQKNKPPPPQHATFCLPQYNTERSDFVKCRRKNPRKRHMTPNERSNM